MKQASISTAKPKPVTGISAVISLIEKLLNDGARAWNLSPTKVAIICSLPFIIALIGGGTALISKDAYKWFTGEDRFAETMQVLFYSLAFLLSLVITYQQWRAGEKLIAFLYLGLSLAIFFLIGEELSWGQRIFGWETSETFASANKQDETNLHNIHGVGATFKWMQLLVGAYGTLLPLVVLRWSAPDRFQKMISMVIPHYTLIPYFLLLFVWRIYRNFFEAPTKYYFAIAEYNEVMELILSIGLFLFIVFQLRQFNPREKTANSPLA